MRKKLFLSTAIACLSAFLPLQANLFKDGFVFIENYNDPSQMSKLSLDEFGYFVTQLLFSRSASLLPMQREAILKHAHPGYLETLIKKILEEDVFLKERGILSSLFYVTNVELDAEKLTFIFTGKRIYNFGKQPVIEKQCYRVCFSCLDSRIFLSGVEELKE